MQDPKPLSVSERIKFFEPGKSDSKAPLISSKPTTSITTVSSQNTKPTQVPTSKPITSSNDEEVGVIGLSVKERMKMFDKSTNKTETQALPPKSVKTTTTKTEAPINKVQQNEEQSVPEHKEIVQVEETQPASQISQEKEQENIVENTQRETEEVAQEKEEIQNIAETPVQEEKQYEEEYKEPVENIEQEVVPEEIVERQEEQEIHNSQENEVREEVYHEEKPTEQVHVEIPQEEARDEQQEKGGDNTPKIPAHEEAKREESQQSPISPSKNTFAANLDGLLGKRDSSPSKSEAIRSMTMNSDYSPSNDNYTDALLNKPVAQLKKRPSSKLEFIDDEDF